MPCLFKVAFFSDCVYYILDAEMNRHLYIWLFRYPSRNAHPQCHICLHSHQLRQTHHDTRLLVFRQNSNHILHRLLNKNWSRKYCHQDTRMLWKHKALQKYMEDLSKEYQALGQCLQDSSVKEGDRRSLKQRHAELAPLTAIYKEIQEAEQAVEELESMCKSGLHHAAARISGDKVYKHLKYEGGVHRVQRIPEVGLSSRMQRIHTGTMSVIVLPQPDEVPPFPTSAMGWGQRPQPQGTLEDTPDPNYSTAYLVDVKVDPRDLRIDTFRSKGAGGQHVNTTDSAVRLVHIPTGLVVECQQERSQLKNKEIALRVLRARLYQQIIEKDKCQQQSARKLQVGTRAQAERIRTYNFTQDRVTDHRIAYEVRDIKEFLCGERSLDQLIQRLLQSADEEAIVELLDENLRSVK
ncbi:peptide chain release factor 1, mitochondrial-like isoform X7 [Castor canadensis]|uniref:Peptide chain release factor 1, mitochondrial-like isoform X7 n=1 Tax=Castor canadensis TaxID=51338 RepID=A0AC58K3F9_CASCN